MHADQLSLLPVDPLHAQTPLPTPLPPEIIQAMADMMLDLVIARCQADGDDMEAPGDDTSE